MYKLKVKLKQHTPLIHFQHEQAGATLRATELKPKLDRFLLKKIGIGDYEKGKEFAKQKKWLIQEQEEALDYKVKIISLGKNITGDVEIMPASQEKWILSDDIELTIFCCNENLRKKIEDDIDHFFCLTNFGKRQNKGFGCFYPEQFDKSIFFNKISTLGYNIYKSDSHLKNKIQKDYYFYDKVIFPKWSKFKSGINHFWKKPAVYKKSEIFNYLESRELRWDKRWIKLHLNELIEQKRLPKKLKQQNNDPIDLYNKNSWVDSSAEEYRFGRAMLGLPEHYEFQTTDSNIKYQVKIKSENIERFKSPITFKIFENEFYAIAKNINAEMFNCKFSFSVQAKQKKGRDFINEGKPIEFVETLSTPKENEFNLNNFLDNHFKSIGFVKLKNK